PDGAQWQCISPCRGLLLGCLYREHPPFAPGLLTTFVNDPLSLLLRFRPSQMSPGSPQIETLQTSSYIFSLFLLVSKSEKREWVEARRQFAFALLSLIDPVQIRPDCFVNLTMYVGKLCSWLPKSFPTPGAEASRRGRNLRPTQSSIAGWLT